LKMKRGLGCSYRPMESNGNIPARAAGSFIACMSLARRWTEHWWSAVPPPATVNPPAPSATPTARWHHKHGGWHSPFA
jgi:hypothetical protein